MNAPARLNTSAWQKILVVNIFGIGDVLFTTPLLRNIKKASPGVSVFYLANRRAADVLAHNPHVDRVLIYERDAFEEIRRRSRMEYLRKALAFFQSVRREHFDAAFDLSLNSPMNFMLRAAGIRTIAGYNYRKRSPFLTHRIEFSGYEQRPVAEYYYALGRLLGWDMPAGPLEMPVSAEDRRWAEDFFRRQKLSEAPLVVAMAPGGGASWGAEAGVKQWPAGRYALLANKVIEKFSAKVILLGDLKEKELGAVMEQQCPSAVVNACGLATLPQTRALLERCSLAVVNDGGLLHVATAAGTKTVSVFGPVDEYVYGPYPLLGHQVVVKDIPCRPCYRQFRRARCEHLSCMTGISVETVFDKVVRELSAPG